MTAKKTPASKTPARKTKAAKAVAAEAPPPSAPPLSAPAAAVKTAAAKGPVKKSAAKKSAAKKSVAKKSASKKSVAKKAVTKKSLAKKTVAQKAAPKKTAVKKAIAKKQAPKKSAARKAVVKKSAAKKAVVKTAAVKKTSPVKKALAKNPPVKKAALKKVALKKAAAKKPVAAKTKPARAPKKAKTAAVVKTPISKTSVVKTPVAVTKIKTASKSAGSKVPKAARQAEPKRPVADAAAPVAVLQKPVAPAPRHKANPEVPRSSSVIRVRQTPATRAPLPVASIERPKVAAKAVTVAKPIAGARVSRLAARPKSSRSPARGVSSSVAAIQTAVAAKDVRPRLILDVPLSEERLRQNIRTSIFFLEAWLRSGGADSTPDLLEMAGAAEAARAQIWRWLDQAAQFEDGRTIDAVSFEIVLHREMLALREDIGEQVFNAGLFQTASELFVNLALAPDFHDFPDHVTTH